MNKKIKFIEIFQKYVNGEQMPKTIKRGSSVLDYDNKDKKYYERGSEKCIYLSIENFKELENEFEILEDNTEDKGYELLKTIKNENNFEGFEDMGYEYGKFCIDFYKGVRKAFENELRKEKEDD